MYNSYFCIQYINTESNHRFRAVDYTRDIEVTKIIKAKYSEINFSQPILIFEKYNCANNDIRCKQDCSSLIKVKKKSFTLNINNYLALND